jgi:hypothetical protein
MIGQDTGEGGLGLRLDERFDRARRKFGEGGVGRRKDGERALTLEGVDKPCRGDGGNERFERTRTDRGVLSREQVAVRLRIGGVGEFPVLPTPLWIPLWALRLAGLR